MSVYGGQRYIVDSQTSSLRVINKDGLLKTLYSNKISSNSPKKLQNPKALIVDDTGAYISDSFNHVIRKYDFSSSQIRDFIGSRKHGNGVGTSANTQFDEPEGIIAVLDRFYISDSNNNRILAIGRGSLNSELLDVMPPLRLPKEGFLQYLPNLQKAEEIDVKSDAEVVIKIDLKKGWKINESGPSFINLLQLVDDDKANMVASFDWHAVSTKEIKLPKLKDGKDYMLQGAIYFCEDKRNSLCYIKSYEQRIEADSGEEKSQIEIKLGY